MRATAQTLVLLALFAGLFVLSVATAPQISSATIEQLAPPMPATISGDGAVWAMSFVRARPGQRERLERFLRLNWLALDEEALQQKRITAYRMLRADVDRKGESWDYAVTIEYANRKAMEDFVPFYVALVRERPHLRVDGLDFADLGQVVQQKVVEPLSTLPDPGAEPGDGIR